MSFEAHIPAHIKEVEKTIEDLRKQKWAIDWGHECNCEYCDRDGDDADPEAEKLDSELDQKIHEARNLIETLKRHAKEHGVKI